MNDSQKETRDSLINNRYTIEEMNAFLVESQNDLQRAKAGGNERVIQLHTDYVVGIAAALVHAAKKGDEW